MSEAGPTTARAYCSRKVRITYRARSSSPLVTTTNTESWMYCDEKNFTLANTLSCTVDGVDFFSKTWHDIVPRNGV